MVTKQSASVSIVNNTGGNASIQMCHQYGSAKPDTGSWQLAPGQQSTPMTVNFETGFGSQIADWWWVTIQVKDGPTPGNYASSGSGGLSSIKECMLRATDANKSITNRVDTKTFAINLESRPCTAAMNKVSQYSPITNVFVLMLENRSFDHMLGFSGITGINGLSGSESNSIGTDTYTVRRGARDPMTTDPGHEFLDTLQQLCGAGVPNPFPAGPYPAINNSGFALNYSTPKVDGTKTYPPPAQTDVGDIMACCRPDEIPALYQLASNYVVCDQWFSSMPGPTWPNRLFAMCGGASGLDVSPDGNLVKVWETFSGLQPKQGTIFQRLSQKALSWRIYHDASDLFSTSSTKGTYFNGGSWAIAGALKGISQLSSNVQDFKRLAADLQSPYGPQFTWIEPNYGDASSGTYVGGSSQHPTDSLAAGDALIAATYNAIRNSPLWPTSLLIITYDEHGGFYDHVPPLRAIPPDDTISFTIPPPPGTGLPPTVVPLNRNGFDFSRLGVRVPTVIVCPQMTPRSVDHTVYDHTSIVKTVTTLFGLPALTKRDADPTTNSLVPLLSGQPQTHSIGLLDVVARSADEPAPVPDEIGDRDADAALLPDTGHIHGAILLAARAETELLGGDDEATAHVAAKVRAITTHGDAKQYMGYVAQKIADARAAAV